ncbi:hypothetical protein [Micromonospora sp. NBC_01412]|uniref:hypothetical protein n=1 Tax=Micromonospora sp. NBC_01412 TaxID=2903590 RepID=UPI003251BA0B
MPPRERSGAGGAERAEVAGFPPEVAGALLHLAHERELAEIQRHIDELTEAHRARQLALDRRLATALTGPDAIAEGLGQVRAATRDELRCLVRAGGWRPPADLPYRMVVEVPPTRAGNRAVGGAAGAAGGPTVRWLPELPVSLYLADDRLGLVARGDLDAAVLVYPSLLLDVLGGLFEALWARADPHHAGGSADRWGDLPDLLLAGLTDQAIGRQFGVSDRTVQRRIAELMVEFGAATRFQAGVRAALRAGADSPAGGPGRSDDPAGSAGRGWNGGRPAG